MRRLAAPFVLTAVLTASTLVGVRSLLAPEVPRPGPHPLEEGALDDLTLPFIENRGQLQADLDYYLEGPRGSIGFSPRGLLLSAGSGALELSFPGAQDVAPVGLGRTPTVVSYFRGRPSEWLTALPTYSRVMYEDLWPGVDVVYSGTGERLKYRFMVEPGADASAIGMAWRGPTELAVDDGGDLEITTPDGVLVDEAPRSWQTFGGRRVEVPTTYSLDGRLVGFEMGAHDRTRPLVIDPALVYSGFVGGDLNDRAFGVAVDGAGSAYIAGYTESLEATFPDKGGPDVTFQGGTSDAFVAKIDPSGTGLVYAGYIGGTDDEQAAGIAVDGAGSAYLIGRTDSTAAEDFPAAVGPDLLQNGGFDAFVAKVTPDGTGLAYAGYIGGTGFDEATAVDVGGDGSAFVTGFTDSTEATFPDTVGPDPSYNTNGDAFVAKVKPSGASLDYAGYIGGTGGDGGNGIAVDGGGSAYVTGTTSSDDAGEAFPVMTGPDLVYNGGEDAFVVKVQPSGAALVYAGYIGGNINDFGRGIAVDGAGAAFVTGDTGSAEATFPEMVGPDLTFNGDVDAFVARVQPSGAGLDFAGYLGGANGDIGYGIGLDPAGDVYLAGQTNSSEATFPEAVGPDLTFNGGFDAFVAKLASSGTGIVYAGYIGGSGSDFGYGLAVDAGGNAFVAGKTSSTEATFPVLAGPDLTQNMGEDAFVAKVETTVQCLGTPVTRLGTPGDDVITGTLGVDAVASLDGNDSVAALGGGDLLCLGPGNDKGNGGGGKDRLLGEQGKDRLKGAGGKDRLDGGPQRDLCNGGPGRDKARKCERKKRIP